MKKNCYLSGTVSILEDRVKQLEEDVGKLYACIDTLCTALGINLHEKGKPAQVSKEDN